MFNGKTFNYDYNYPMNEETSNIMDMIDNVFRFEI